jgi:hypothetical protein
MSFEIDLLLLLLKSAADEAEDVTLLESCGFDEASPSN